MGPQESSLQNFDIGNFDIGNIKIVQDSGNEKAMIAIKNHKYESIKAEYQKKVKELSNFFFDLDGSYIDSLDEETLQGLKNIISWKIRRRLLFPLALSLINAFVMCGWPLIFTGFSTKTFIVLGIMLPLFPVIVLLAGIYTPEIDFYFTEKKLKKLDHQT